MTVPLVKLGVGCATVDALYSLAAAVGQPILAG
jgi:hypothetical protein